MVTRNVAFPSLISNFSLCPPTTTPSLWSSLSLQLPPLMVVWRQTFYACPSSRSNQDFKQQTVKRLKKWKPCNLVSRKKPIPPQTGLPNSDPFFLKRHAFPTVRLSRSGRKQLQLGIPEAPWRSSKHFAAKSCKPLQSCQEINSESLILKVPKSLPTYSTHNDAPWIPFL